MDLGGAVASSRCPVTDPPENAGSQEVPPRQPIWIEIRCRVHVHDRLECRPQQVSLVGRFVGSGNSSWNAADRLPAP
jgi:hypothetical protein